MTEYVPDPPQFEPSISLQRLVLGGLPAVSLSKSSQSGKFEQPAPVVELAPLELAVSVEDPDEEPVGLPEDDWLLFAEVEAEADVVLEEVVDEPVLVLPASDPLPELEEGVDEHAAAEAAVRSKLKAIRERVMISRVAGGERGR